MHTAMLAICEHAQGSNSCLPGKYFIHQAISPGPDLPFGSLKTQIRYSQTTAVSRHCHVCIHSCIHQTHRTGSVHMTWEWLGLFLTWLKTSRKYDTELGLQEITSRYIVLSSLFPVHDIANPNSSGGEGQWLRMLRCFEIFGSYFRSSYIV